MFALIQRSVVFVDYKTLHKGNVKSRQNEMKYCKINDVLLWKIVIPFHFLRIKSRKSKVFTHSDFRMALSFVMIGTIAATVLKFINNAST